MTRSWLPCWLAVAYVTGCTLSPNDLKTPAPATTVRSTSPTPRPTTNASASPIVVSTGPANGLLLKPTTPVTTLTGTISLDANYAVRSGQGTLIGQGGATLIGQDGASAVSFGGNVVAGGGGNLIGQGGATLQGSRGAAIATGNDGYGVLATGESGPGLAVGQILPAAGMEIRVIGMASGAPVSLGLDAIGKPVHSVFSNAAGEFEVYLPAGVEGLNVRVVATPPAATDLRLSYSLVTSLDSRRGHGIDEDTALVSSYITEAFAARVDRMFRDNTGPDSYHEFVPPFMTATSDIEEMLKQLIKAADNVNARQMTPAARSALVHDMVDRTLSTIDLESIVVFGGTKKVLDVLPGLLKDLREHAALKLAADPLFFANADFVVAANNALPAGELPLVIERPSDLMGDFILRGILPYNTTTVTTGLRFAEIIQAVELTDPSGGVTMYLSMQGIIASIYAALSNPRDRKALDRAKAAISQGAVAAP